MKKNQIKTIVIRALSCLIIIWILVVATDFIRTMTYELPVFAVLQSGYDDYKLVTYQGLGYKIKTNGPYSEFYLFSIKIAYAAKT